MVIPTLHRGGAERVLSRLSEEWARQGYEVVVAVFDSREVAYEINGRIIGLDSPASNNKLVKAWRLLGRVAKLVTLIREVKPTHLIGFMEYGNFPLILAATLTGNLARTIVSIHRNPKQFFAHQKILFPILYHLPNKIVVVSDGIKQRLQKFGVPKGKLSVIFNPPPPPPKNPYPHPLKKNPLKLAKNIFWQWGGCTKKKGLTFYYKPMLACPTQPPTQPRLW
ncbi:MAG: glycosyltransferase [Proteobacteria bacterium]|nr:glycosyltransferase [Pseudomonadota bacterium]